MTGVYLFGWVYTLIVDFIGVPGKMCDWEISESMDGVEDTLSYINPTSAGTIGGTIISSTTDAVANTQQASISMQQTVPFTVHVSPQPVFIQVQTTF